MNVSDIGAIEYELRSVLLARVPTVAKKYHSISQKKTFLKKKKRSKTDTEMNERK